MYSLRLNSSYALNLNKLSNFQTASKGHCKKHSALMGVKIE